MFEFHKCASATKANFEGERGEGLKTAINPLLLSPVHFFMAPSVYYWCYSESRAVRNLNPSHPLCKHTVHISVNEGFHCSSQHSRSHPLVMQKLIKLLWEWHSKPWKNQGSYLEVHLSRMDHSFRSDLTDARVVFWFCFLWLINC